MTNGKPARTAVGGTPQAAYGRRRGRALFTAVLVLLLFHTVFAAAGRSLSYKRHALDDNQSAPVSWPQQGQAAFVLGAGRPGASPHEQPMPIASLAKVMTAYLTLKRYPLRGAQAGFVVTVTEAQGEAATQDAAQDQSDVAVQAGEELTERQLLEALLIPSGNNIAWMLAGVVAGSDAGFVDEMNVEAHVLGMHHTIYTDPSGFDPNTVSTAADQLRVFRQAMGFATFRQIVSMPSVTLPVAGTLPNFNPLIAQGYAGKTGSDSAAGGCLAFFTRLTVGRPRQTAVGVVMGQGQGSDTPALLAAAGEAAQQLTREAARQLTGEAARQLTGEAARQLTGERAHE